jgi:hypothetical protein
MEYILTAPRVFDRMIQIDKLCLPKNSIYTPEDKIVIDLSNVTFIKPLGVIGVLLLVENITKLSVDIAPLIEIIPPKNSEVTDYLLKVNFVDVLVSLTEWNIQGELAVSGRRLKPVIPITRFRTPQEIENIANDMQGKFHTELARLTSLLQPCHLVFSELANNVIEHANSSGGFVLAQQYDYTEGSVIEIAVGDCGIGILSSLRQKHANKLLVTDDRQAIKLVLGGGFSRINDSYRGYGINHIMEEMIRAPDRVLTIRSGNGYSILSTGNKQYSAKCEFFPGTLTYAIIPC